MFNSDPATGDRDASAQQDADVDAILQSGAMGAVVLVGLATTIVVAIWVAFYLLVFLPRVIAP